MKNNKVAGDVVIKNKKMYLFLLGITIIGIISGMIFISIISKNDKILVINKLTTFFTNIKNNTNISYIDALINSVIANISYIAIVWLLGISIVGSIGVIFLLYLKGFVLGFSISSIISVYKFKGILGTFVYIFPHQLIGIILSILLSFYSINFSIKLFRYLFLKHDINFKLIMHKYIKILLIILGCFIILSLFEVFISPFFIKLFTKLI